MKWSAVSGQWSAIHSRLRLRKAVHGYFYIALLFGLAGKMPAQSRTEGPADTYAWQPPPVETVKAQVLAWLNDQRADESAKAKVRELWASIPPSPTEEELLERVANSFAAMDAKAERLIALCRRPRSNPVPPAPAWLDDTRTSPFAARNLRLYYARWLAQNALNDEAREQLSGLEPGGVVAPAALLFYQSVVSQKLLDRQSGLQTLDQLLSGPPTSPRRYLAVAKLMQEDLQNLEDDSLDHISRRMEDIGRRLDLGRAGPKVRGLEDGVIESLDKHIKKMENEQQRQSASSSGKNIRSSNPAPDSRILTGKGPGQVEKKSVGGQSGWGNLPPKEREEALQQIGRDFPAQYRDVIAEYFKRLAAEENP
jgi:hypothetical protein